MGGGKKIKGIEVQSFEKCKELKLPFAVCVKNQKYRDEIVTSLRTENVEWYEDIFRCLQLKFGFDSTMLNRRRCEYFHIDSMNRYFEEAESDASLDMFWNDKSPFYQMFKKLDLDEVIELACGRGRHVLKYANMSNHITLVDVLEKNIQYCKNRFSNIQNISYYKNNGVDLSNLNDNKYSSLFTYDAMVHFEMLDIYNYLKETYRVLKDEGMALFHHSNMALSYKQTFMESGNPGGRNFMSKEIFGYLAYKAGFDILEQKVIDWSLPNMDCITLVQKHV